jgi:hypothetical protein
MVSFIRCLSSHCRRSAALLQISRRYPTIMDGWKQGITNVAQCLPYSVVSGDVAGDDTTKGHKDVYRWWPSGANPDHRIAVDPVLTASRPSWTIDVNTAKGSPNRLPFAVSCFTSLRWIATRRKESWCQRFVGTGRALSQRNGRVLIIPSRCCYDTCCGQ